MNYTLITNAKIVNEGNVFEADVLIKGPFIEKIGRCLSVTGAHEVVDAKGQFMLPGIIDDQVHFREPGLTHKATIFTESRAAVAGGVTSFMEMPNTVPPSLTQKLLDDKYQIAARSSLANYSFYMGASNDNWEEIMRTDITTVCGLKIFMGSSTGHLLVDNPHTLALIFSKFPSLIATHCEDESIIRHQLSAYREKYGDNCPVQYHPLIRSEEACYQSSSYAVSLAKKYGTRLHVLHLSTAKEISLFDNTLPLTQKRITAEACVHHLWFNDADYARLGMNIKWNPAIKTAYDQSVLFNALLSNHIDVIATDHAPHTVDEKNNSYFKAPSGGPLIQHSLIAMLNFYKKGKIRLDKIVEKMSHNPALLFQIDRRGFIREGYYADLVLVDPDCSWTVAPENILSKCGWSPFEGVEFNSKITNTWVSGYRCFKNGSINEGKCGERLKFLRS